MNFHSRIQMAMRIAFLTICTLALQPAAAQSLYFDNFGSSTLDPNIWIVSILKEADAGVTFKDLCGKHVSGSGSR